jgi:hypothetical protein
VETFNVHRQFAIGKREDLEYSKQNRLAVERSSWNLYMNRNTNTFVEALQNIFLRLVCHFLEALSSLRFTKSLYKRCQGSLRKSSEAFPAMVLAQLGFNVSSASEGGK